MDQSTSTPLTRAISSLQLHRHSPAPSGPQSLPDALAAEAQPRPARRTSSTIGRTSAPKCPSLRMIAPTAAPASYCRRQHAICSSVNRFRFIGPPSKSKILNNLAFRSDQDLGRRSNATILAPGMGSFDRVRSGRCPQIQLRMEDRAFGRYVHKGGALAALILEVVGKGESSRCKINNRPGLFAA